MCIESARAYVQRRKADKEFYKKIKECKNSIEHETLLKSEGLYFTAEEFKQAIKEITY